MSGEEVIGGDVVPTVRRGSSISHLLQDSNFRLWWIGFGISLLGDQFYLVALPWVILQLTGSGIAMGTILMLAAWPRAVLMLMGGAISDRMSPRRIMMATASSRTILVAAIGYLLGTHALQLWHLYFLVFIFGVADAFALPAFQAFLPLLVVPEQLVAANSVNQATIQLAVTVGPAPAGWVVNAFGAAWAFFVDAVSFLFIIAALWKLPDQPRRNVDIKKVALWRSITEGLRYVYEREALRALVLLSAVLSLCIIGPITIGLAFLAKEEFGSPTVYGFWVSSFAAGGLIGSLLASLRRQTKRGLLLLSMNVITAVAIVSLAFVRQIWLIACILSIMSSTSGFVGVHFQAWCQQNVDRAILGRLMSVFMLASAGLTPLSLFIAGMLARSHVQALFLISGLSVLVTVGFAAMHRTLRELQ